MSKKRLVIDVDASTQLQIYGEAEIYTKKGSFPEYFWMMHDVFLQVHKLAALYTGGDVREFIIQMRAKMDHDLKKQLGGF